MIIERRPAPGAPRPRSARRIVANVFARSQRPALQRVVPAFAAAVLLHAAIIAAARMSEPSLESWSAQIAARVHAELSRVEEIELLRPPEVKKPPPAPAPPPARAARAAAPGPRRTPAAAPSPRSPPAAASTASREPARAGKVVSAEPDPDVPVDQTSFDIATGHADVYAGGDTASSGTSEMAVHGPVRLPEEPRGAHGGEGRGDGGAIHGGTLGADGGRASSSPRPDRSRPVGLQGGEWSCPWPREADEEQIDHQVVVLRVVVREDGSVESARLVTDPGHGFGAAALACARRTRFVPARDAGGRAIRAPSPPIRVHFSR
jgi:protein TonB